MSRAAEVPPPRRPGFDRLLAAWTLSLVVAFGVLAAVAVRDSRLLEPPPSSAIAPPSASPSATSAAPSVRPPQSIAEQVAAVEAQMPAIRDLAPLRSVPTHVIAPSDLPAVIRRIVDELYTPAELRGEQDFLVRLGLASPGLDLRAITVQSMSAQVLGFYEPATKAMTIVNRIGSFGLIADYTVAHEYTHALQDQHFDLLDMGLGRVTTTDRTLALQALIEGDASLAGQQWMMRHASQGLSIADLLDLGNVLVQSIQPVVPPGSPAILERETLFPYIDGLAFAQTLFARGGWSAVDAAYARPPTSASQILHPERYLQGWVPASVAAPGLQGLGAGWRLAYRDTLGELGVQQVLTGTAAASGGLAAAWDGDEAQSWDGPGGAWAVVWRSRWTSAAEAVTFEAAWSTRAPGPASIRTAVDGDVVTILLASDSTVATAASSIALNR